jgi:hypothetical protein
MKDKKEYSREYHKNHRNNILERKRMYYIDNKERIQKYHKQRHRFQHLKRLYGITVEDYGRMFIEQNGRCAICGKHQLELSCILGVDHDHVTGKIRGLLCVNCNRNLGILENIEFVEKVKKYLEK